MSQTHVPYSNRHAGTSQEPGFGTEPAGMASYGPRFATAESSDDLNIEVYPNPDILSSSNTGSLSKFSTLSSIPSIPYLSTTDSHSGPRAFGYALDITNPTSNTNNDPTKLQLLTDGSAVFQGPSTISDTPVPGIDRDLTTRNLCILALMFGWGVAFASLAVGIYIIVGGQHQTPPFLMNTLVAVGNVNFAFATPKKVGSIAPYILDHRAFEVSEPVMILVSLLLTFILTTMLDSMSFIHTTSLRWALWREGRSMTNSNIRLFTSSKTHLPNQWPANVVACLALVFAYGGITILIFNVYIQARLIRDGAHTKPVFDVAGNRYGIDFNAWGLVGLGAGTFLQALMSTLCLVYRSGLIATWSSNPLATAKACQLLANNNEKTYFAEKAQMSRSEISTSNSNVILLHDCTKSISSTFQSATPSNTRPSTSTAPHAFSRPRTMQLPARACVSQMRRVMMIIWILWAAFALYVVIVAIIAKRFESISDTFVREATGRVDLLAYLQTFGQISIVYTTDPELQRRGWRGLLIQSFVFSFVLCYLHLVELITLIIRDEKIWRKATTRNGAEIGCSTLLQASPNWQCWIVCAFKSIIPWIFSYGFSCNMGVFMNLIPLAMVAILFLFLALFAECLVRWKPKGSQPATYGNVAALIALVDDWDHKVLFWGEKRPVIDGFGKAGTAGLRLADVKPNQLYTRLRANIDS